MEISERLTAARGVRLGLLDTLALWTGLTVWVSTFLLGTLVDSRPYRDLLAGFAGGVTGTIRNGAIVVFTYTLTNVAVLCIVAGLLGTLGAKARLGADNENDGDDETSPGASALLRGFLVYLFVIAGLLVLGNDPLSPTQQQYVRLAGFISLLGFIVNYRPSLFAALLHRAGAIVEGSGDKP